MALVGDGKRERPTLAALAGLILCLPGALMYGLLTFNIDPTFGVLERGRSPDQPDIAGSIIALAVLVLLPLVAFLLNLGPIRRAARAGNGFFARPANVAVAVAALLVGALVLDSIVVDQYPCWMGVPNCD